MPRLSTSVGPMAIRGLAVILVTAAAWTWVSWDGAAPVRAAGAADAGRDIAVVLHGLGRNKRAMRPLAERLETAGYQVFNIGYQSLRKAPEEILGEVTDQIAACCLARSKALHFVGHSLGGLVIRAYLADNPVANLGRVVLIGTPNKGTAIVDKLKRKWWFKVAGPTARSLGTDAASFPNSLPAPTYAVGVIAGRKTGRSNEHVLPGEDDGLVAVEATKLDGMRDFIVIDTGHSAMRYDADVAQQTLHFLNSGSFARP